MILNLVMHLAWACTVAVWAIWIAYYRITGRLPGGPR